MFPFVLIIERKAPSAKEGRVLEARPGMGVESQSTTAILELMVCLGSGHCVSPWSVHRATHLVLGQKKRKRRGLGSHGSLGELNPCDG